VQHKFNKTQQKVGKTPIAMQVKTRKYGNFSYAELWQLIEFSQFAEIWENDCGVLGLTKER
jgi:hypothetical protein